MDTVSIFFDTKVYCMFSLESPPSRFSLTLRYIMCSH